MTEKRIMLCSVKLNSLNLTDLVKKIMTGNYIKNSI